MKTSRILLVASLALVQLIGCKDDPVDTDLPTLVIIPETYDFENVSFQGQKERLDQVEELSAYIKTANQTGVSLDNSVLNAMFQNTNNDGNGNFTFTSTKQLKDKCFELDQTLIESYFTMAVEASESDKPGSNGQAGRILSEDGEASRLFNENGWEPEEIIEKTLMGAVMYYQATSVYLSADKMEVDNENVEEGEGTAMQHHWDEAYG